MTGINTKIRSNGRAKRGSGLSHTWLEREGERRLWDYDTGWIWLGQLEKTNMFLDGMVFLDANGGVVWHEMSSGGAAG